MNGRKAPMRRLPAQPHAAPRLPVRSRADGAGLHAPVSNPAQRGALGVLHRAGCLQGKAL